MDARAEVKEVLDDGCFLNEKIRVRFGTKNILGAVARLLYVATLSVLRSADDVHIGNMTIKPYHKIKKDTHGANGRITRSPRHVNTSGTYHTDERIVRLKTIT